MYAHIQLGARDLVAMAHSGSDLGPPALRPQYASDFYAAYCRDPEGHKLCFVHTADPAA